MTMTDFFPFQDGAPGNQDLNDFNLVEQIANHLMNQTSLLIWTTNKELTATYLSASFEPILGIEPQNIVGSSIMNVYLDIDDINIIKAHQAALSGQAEQFIFTLDGIKYYQNRVEPLKDKDGEIIGTIGWGVEMADQTLNHHESTEHTMLRTLIDHIPDPIYAKDIHGRKTLSNQADLASMGIVDEKEAIGKTDAAFYPSKLAAKFMRDDAHVIRAGKPIINQVEQSISDDGKKHSFLSSKIPIKDENGKVIGLIGISHNITKQIEAEEEVRRLNAHLEQRVSFRTAELQAVNRELESFSYSVSHDLRAPLRSIVSFSKALEEDYGDLLKDDAKDYLDRIIRAGSRMTQLIDDLLKLSQISRCEINYEKVNISDMSQAILNDLQMANPKRTVCLKIDPDLCVYADCSLMRIVMDNLISNAWKFTSKHESALIEIGKLNQNGEEIIYIKDDGAGFDMAYSSKLFSAFQRLHHPAEFEGSGIGLATVQRIINRHGGRVWADSKVEKGTTIFFSIHEKYPEQD